jgi:hypothetical protein
MYPALAEAGAGYILSVLSQMNQKTAQDWTETGRSVGLFAHGRAICATVSFVAWRLRFRRSLDQLFTT